MNIKKVQLESVISDLTSLDKLIILASLLVLILLYIFTWSGSESDRYVSLSVSGEKKYIIDLYEEKVISVKGVRGESKLEVVNGRIRFIESPCNTHFCIRSGWLNQSIGILACLPNGISLHFAHKNNPYDAINF